MLRLASLVPWMVMTAAFAQEPESVQVDYTYKGVQHETAFRVDSDCLAPSSLLKQLGWDVRPFSGGLEVQAEGRVMRLMTTSVHGKPCVSMQEAARFLGAKASWSSDNKTYSLRSWIRSCEVGPQGVRIDGTLSYLPNAFKMHKPERLVIDCVGAEIHDSVPGSLPTGWRATQFKPNTVRFVYQNPSVASAELAKLSVGRTQQLALPPPEVFDPQLTPAKPVIQPDDNPPAVVSTPKPAAKGDNDELIVIPFTGVLRSGPSASFVTPEQIEVTLIRARPDETGADGELECSYAKAFKFVEDGKGNLKVIIDLKRPVAFQVSVAEGHVQLRLVRPRVSDGKIAGKVVVIDPGHGGKDSGAQSNGILEKDLNLSLGRKLADVLTKNGFSVILTRADDRFIPLKARSQQANDARADLFISIHANSNRTAGSRSGGMVFHHKEEPVGVLFSTCVQNEIAKIKRIPNLGIRSDLSNTQTGYSVLRNTTMPAILIEVGFVNHQSDRATMLDTKFQDSMAQAITKGVKVFLGDVNE